MKPRVKDVLVCDEVRVEVNGKKIFIGVYGDDIIVNALPAQLSHLAFVIAVEGLSKGQTPLEFIFESVTGKELIRAKSDLNVSDPSRFSRLVLSVGNVLFFEEGEHTIKIGIGKQKPSVCHRLQIILPPKPRSRSRGKPAAVAHAKRAPKKSRPKSGTTKIRTSSKS